MFDRLDERLLHVFLRAPGFQAGTYRLVGKKVSTVALNDSGVMRFAALAAMTLVMAGCIDQSGFSGRDAEWNRLRGDGPFNIVSVNHERAVVSARGRQVAIEAAEGFCLAKESIETSGRSAFAMIGDCVLEDPQARDQAALAGLPQGVPGIITVSISGDQGYTRDGDGAGSLTDLSEFLKTSEGRSMLGRGGASTSVSIEESRTIDNGLYVLVEDKNTDVIPILAPRFWRSFVDLNDRLTVVTISSFREKPLGNDEMLKYLVNQVKTLADANRYPLNEQRTLVAEADTSRQDTPNAVQALADLKPETLTITAELVREDILWPVPRGRPEVDPEAEGSGEEILEAPEDADPSVALEIASATETIPVPIPRGGTSEPAVGTPPQAAQAESSTDTEAAAALQTADASDAGSVDVNPIDASSGNAAPANSATPATGDETASDQTAPIAEQSGTPAASEETVATTDQAVEPDQDTAPTAHAPKNAPEAPKRPQSG